jgi:hypothetical protein
MVIRPGYSADGCTGFTFKSYSFDLVGHKKTLRGTLLLLSLRRRDCLIVVEFDFGVREVFELFDLQALAFVGSDVEDEDHFAVYLNPN